MLLVVLNVKDALLISDRLYGSSVSTGGIPLQFTVVSVEMIELADGLTVQLANALLLAVIRMPADVSDKATN